MRWALIVTRSARKDLRAVPGRDLARIDDAFEQMRDDPRGGDTRGLKGTAGVLRRRVGPWRIFFEVDPKQHRVVILGVKRRTSTTY